MRVISVSSSPPQQVKTATGKMTPALSLLRQREDEDSGGDGGKEIRPSTAVLKPRHDPSIRPPLVPSTWGCCCFLVAWRLSKRAKCPCLHNLTCYHTQISCRSNLVSHPVTVHTHRANQTEHWPFNTRPVAGQPQKNQFLGHCYDSTGESRERSPDLQLPIWTPYHASEAVRLMPSLPHPDQLHRPYRRMNWQIDWQAQQTSYEVYSLAGQKHWVTWGIFWAWTDHSITALAAWMKKGSNQHSTIKGRERSVLTKSSLILFPTEVLKGLLKGRGGPHTDLLSATVPS